eukprot:scaffold129385_cov84-Phaeocystis_antarctica.AAC.1
MYSATLLASLLASAHGFASTPEAPEVDCSANEEKFFVTRSTRHSGTRSSRTWTPTSTQTLLLTTASSLTAYV